ncbi:MAG: TetR family transcriptional regulator [Chloroflexota bacterium]
MGPSEIKRKVERLPARPGVYILKNAKGTVIYVGQSANLRKRVAGYFRLTSRRSSKTNKLVAEISDFDFTATPTQLDALKLERQLIKEHQPKYNKVRLTPQFILERKKQILDAATKIFAAKGFDRATIADVAREAGVAEGSIYNYFKNKDDLLVSIPRQAIQPPIESVVAMVRAAADTPIPPEQMLPIAAKNMAAVFHQNGHIFRILFSALPTMSPSARKQYLNRVIFYVWDILESYFRELIEKGILRRELHPAILTRAFVGMFIPFLLLEQILGLEGSAEFDFDRIIAENIAVFLRGALAEDPERETKRAQKIAIE